MAGRYILDSRAATISSVARGIRRRATHGRRNAKSISGWPSRYDFCYTHWRYYVWQDHDPRSILSSAYVFRGSVFILVILFCLPNPDEVLSTTTKMPIVEMVLQSTGNRAAATILSLMLGICFINGTSASITSASRLLYAMARDRGIVFYNYLSHIHPRLNVPVRAIMLCYIFNACFGVLYLGPAVAFSAYVASCTIFLEISYAFPLIVLLVRGRRILTEHCRSRIATPFRMGELWGLTVNIAATIYLIITSIVSQTPNRRIWYFDRNQMLTLFSSFAFRSRSQDQGTT